MTEHDKKIKIIFFDEAVAFGGSVVVLAHLFNNIDRTRFVPLLVSGLDNEALHTLFKSEDIFFHFRQRLNYVARMRWMDTCPVDSQHAKRLWSYLFTIAQVAANLGPSFRLLFRVLMQRPDLIHNNNDHNALNIARLLNIPLVCHLHGSADASVYALPSMKRARRYIAISAYIAKLAVGRGMDEKRTVIVPNPAPRLEPSNELRWPTLAHFHIEPGSFVIGHVGRLVRWKGQLEFLQAFQQVAAEFPNTIALIVGDDNESFTHSYREDLLSFVRSHSLEARVKFTGHSSEVLQLMSCCDVIVHSSIEPEPFGLVITEAMAAGVAVIASKDGAPAEIIDDGVNGLLVDPKNTAQFADALSLLITDNALRTQFAVEGKRLADERYSPELFARRMESIYQDALYRPDMVCIAMNASVATQGTQDKK